MPRKSRDKDNQSPRQKKPAAGAPEAMPQVWLPDQPDPGIENGFPTLPPNEEGPPPTDEEQQQMALLWAKEEEHAPRGWDEDQELDYTEVVRKREEKEREERENVDTPDLFKYAQSSTYSVKVLGYVDKLPSQTTSDSQTGILEITDRAQKQGWLPWVTSDSDQRVFSISKYGIKVTDMKKQRVFLRHPLHRIVNITYYVDTYGKHMLAVRVAGNVAAEPGNQELHIYESEDEAQARDICLTLAQAFETVYNKLQMQRNLSSGLR